MAVDPFQCFTLDQWRADIILYIQIYFQDLMNWVHYYYHYILTLLPKRRVNLWIRAKLLQIYNHKPKRGAGYTCLHPQVFRGESPLPLSKDCVSWLMGHIYLKSEETFLPDQWYVKLSACVIKLILQEAKGTRLCWTSSHVKPKYWAKWCVFSGRTDSSEWPVVTGMKLFVFNSKSCLMFVFSVWKAWNSSL